MESANTPWVYEEVQYEGLTLRLETSDLLESQFRVTGEVVGSDVGFEVFYSGHSNVWGQKVIPEFSQMEFCSLSQKEFPRVTQKAQKFCIDWAASKAACQQKFASLVAKNKFGEDSAIFFGTVIPYWAQVVEADPTHAVMHGAGHGGPIVGYSSTSVSDEIEFLKTRFLELYERPISKEDFIDWSRLQEFL